MAASTEKISFSEMNEAYHKLVGLHNPRAYALNVVSHVISLALLTFATTALFLPLSRNLVGGFAVGLAGGAFACQLLGGNFKDRKLDLIPSALFSAALLVFGALRLGNLLTTAQMSYGIFGVQSISIIFYCAILRGYVAKSLIKS